MSVSSVLHCSCDSDLCVCVWVRFSGDCFDILLLSAAAHQSSGWPCAPGLLQFHQNTSLERSAEPPLASIVFPDQEKVCPRIANAEITDFNFKRNNTLTCSAICRSLLVSCPPGTMVSSYGRSFLSLLAATCSAVSSDRPARHTLLVSCPSGVCLNRSLLGAMSRQVPCCH